MTASCPVRGGLLNSRRRPISLCTIKSAHFLSRVAQGLPTLSGYLGGTSRDRDPMPASAEQALEGSAASLAVFPHSLRSPHLPLHGRWVDDSRPRQQTSGRQGETLHFQATCRLDLIFLSNCSQVNDSTKTTIMTIDNICKSPRNRSSIGGLGAELQK